MSDFAYYFTAFPLVPQARFHGEVYKDSKTVHSDSIEFRKSAAAVPQLISERRRLPHLSLPRFPPQPPLLCAAARLYAGLVRQFFVIFVSFSSRILRTF